MKKTFTITFSVCIALFFILNAARLLTAGPPARIGVSGWRTIGFPFPVSIENVQYTAAGPVVTVIKNDPRIWLINMGFWLLLSYGFARRFEKNGAAWWRGDALGPTGMIRCLASCGGAAGRAYRFVWCGSRTHST